MIKILLAGNSPSVQKIAALLKSGRHRTQIIRTMDAEAAFNAIVVYQDLDGLIMDKRMDVSRCPAHMQKETGQGESAGYFLASILRECINNPAPVVLVSETRTTRPDDSKYLVVKSSGDVRKTVATVMDIIKKWVVTKETAKKIKPACSVGLVHSQPAIADLVTFVLEEMNVEVLNYGDPDRALPKMKTRLPDLLFVMNMFLFKTSAIDFLGEVKKQWPNKTMKKLLFLNKGWIKKDEIPFWYSLTDDILIKPFDVEELKSMTRSLIDKMAIEKARKGKLSHLAPLVIGKSTSGAVFDPSRYTIGLVWENAEIAELVKIILEAKGYKILEYHTSEKALAEMEKQLPDLLFLCNVMLRQLNGYELMRIIRTRWTRNDVEVIAATVKGGVEGGKAGPFSMVIDKPFDLDLLLAAVERVLRERDERKPLK
ncbi:MAG: response regulator [candidate division FCPU426 bacterium]